MNHLSLKATFCDNINPKQKDSYTLCGKNDIHPACVLTFDLLHPVYADYYIQRSPQYNHSPVIPGFGLPYITYPDNAWAWVFKSNKKFIQLPPPCFDGILALNHSNSIIALATLVRIIAQERALNAQAEICQKTIEAELDGSTFTPPQVMVTCELPESIHLRARFCYNGEWHSLYIFARFSKGSTNIVNFTIRQFNQSATQIVKPNINTCFGENILDAISHVIDATQRHYNVKVYFDAISSGNLVQQPVL